MVLLAPITASNRVICSIWLSCFLIVPDFVPCYFRKFLSKPVYWVFRLWQRQAQRNGKPSNLFHVYFGFASLLLVTSNDFLKFFLFSSHKHSLL